MVASAPHVSWNGSRYLVVWTAGAFLRSSRVEGVLLDPAGGETRFALPPTENPRSITDVSWDGSAFIVSWNEGLYNCQWSPCPPPRYRLGFARISGEEEPALDVTDVGWGILAGHASTPTGQTLFVQQEDERTWAKVFNAQQAAPSPRRRPAGSRAAAGFRHPLRDSRVTRAARKRLKCPRGVDTVLPRLSMTIHDLSDRQAHHERPWTVIPLTFPLHAEGRGFESLTPHQSTTRRGAGPRSEHAERR